MMMNEMMQGKHELEEEHADLSDGELEIEDFNLEIETESRNNPATPPTKPQVMQKIMPSKGDQMIP